MECARLCFYLYELWDTEQAWKCRLAAQYEPMLETDVQWRRNQVRPRVQGIVRLMGTRRYHIMFVTLRSSSARVAQLPLWH